MSTPEQPLTRRQLKEMRRTGQLPVIAPEDADGAAEVVEEAPAPVRAVPDANAEPEEIEAPVEEAPRPLTRRELRMQRMGTNQISVVSVDEAEAKAAEAQEAAPEPSAPVVDEAPPPAEEPEIIEEPEAVEEPVVVEETEAVEKPAAAAARVDEREDPAAVRPAAPEAPEEEAGDAPGAPDEDHAQVGASFGAAVFRQAEERQREEREAAEREAAERREAKEHDEGTASDATAGSDTGELAADAFQRSIHSGGSTSGNTSSLILKDMPGTAALNAPITATGELILTSSHVLPEGIGTHGAAMGTTDGKDIDDVLIDGEIPQHSSPTPIAASSAVSTSKAPGEVIRPPAPEKNHALMLTLGIAAGVLGLGLIGVVVYVFASGALN